MPVFVRLWGRDAMAKARKDYIWKSPSRLTLGVCIVMGLNITVHLMSVGVDAAFGAAASYENAEEFSAPQTLRWGADMLQLVVYLACIIVLLWILRVSRNAHTFKAGLKNTPFGAIIWYVVPFASFFKPYEAMSEIWQASAAPGEDAKGSLLNWWWGVFLLSSLFAGLSARISGADGIPLNVIADLLAIVSSVILIVMARRLSRMQIDKQTIWMTFGDSGPRRNSALEQVSNA
jgi:hypothetical protein